MRAARNPHQIALDQLPQDLAAIDPPQGVDLGPQHRLTIRDNGQSFQGRSRQSGLDGRMVQPPQPRPEPGPRHQLETAPNLLGPKCTSRPVVQPVQPANQCTRFRAVRQAGQVGQLARGERLAGQKQRGFDLGQLRIACKLVVSSDLPLPGPTLPQPPSMPPDRGRPPRPAARPRPNLLLPPVCEQSRLAQSVHRATGAGKAPNPPVQSTKSRQSVEG